MTNITSTEFALWPVRYEQYSKSYYHQSAIPTTSPWALLRLHIDGRLSSVKGDARDIALSCLEQAEFFYNSQGTASNYASKALLLYYSAMNLAKTYLIARQIVSNPDKGFRHGLDANFSKGKPSDPLDGVELEFKKTDPSKPKEQYMIFDELLKSYGYTLNSKIIVIKELLPQIVIGHRLWLSHDHISTFRRRIGPSRGSRDLAMVNS